jgi:lysophospholipase L1-like esterase
MLRTMRKTKRRLTKLAFALYGLGLGASIGAQPLPTGQRQAPRATVVDTRWQDSFDAVAAADRQQSPKPGGVLFVGSSSIRLWSDLETQFSDLSVVKRGFGGSRMLDVAAHVDQLVLPYQPRLIVVYAGDNDLAEGRTPAEVLGSFTQFVQRVRAELPATRIAYLSIKPSPLRASLMPQAIEANRLIAQYSESTPNLDYIDIYSRMLGADGQPRADLYGSDSLHMNPAGYAVWKSAISPHLVVQVPGEAMAAAVPGSPTAPGITGQPKLVPVQMPASRAP